jgi:hypothetical protein
MLNEIETSDSALHPLDNIEAVMKTNNWIFNRMSDDELFVRLGGEEAEYTLYFMWEDRTATLQFCCQYEMDTDEQTRQSIRNAINTLNETLVLGHFTLPEQSGKPTFRHTTLLRGLRSEPHAYLGDLIDLTLSQCERCYQVFKMVTAGQLIQGQALELAMMDTQGRS